MGAVADAVSGGVLAHGDIKHPVEIVFDAPMCAHYCGQPLGVQAGGEDVIAGVNRLVAIGGLAHRLDAGDGADIGEAMALFQFGSRNDPGAAADKAALLEMMMRERIALEDMSPRATYCA